MKAAHTCRKQLSTIEGSVSRLIDPNSEEWKSLSSENTKVNLKKMADEVKTALNDFKSDHPEKK